MSEMKMALKLQKVNRMIKAAEAGAITAGMFTMAAVIEKELGNMKLSEFCTEVGLRYNSISTNTSLNAKALNDEIRKELGVE